MVIRYERIIGLLPAGHFWSFVHPLMYLMSTNRAFKGGILSKKWKITYNVNWKTWLPKQLLRTITCCKLLGTAGRQNLKLPHNICNHKPGNNRVLFLRSLQTPGNVWCLTTSSTCNHPEILIQGQTASILDQFYPLNLVRSLCLEYQNKNVLFYFFCSNLPLPELLICFVSSLPCFYHNHGKFRKLFHSTSLESFI